MAPNIRPTLSRKDSNASEDDFFDIPDEPLLAILKRQLRHVRTWVVFALILLYLFWPKSDPPPYQAAPRQSHVDYDLVDWSRYGYTVYATSSAYICNALMVFEALDRLGSRAKRVLFYPEQWDVFMESDRGRDESLLVAAAERYGVQLVPVDAQMMRGGGESNEPWDKSITKLLAFGETEFDRVIHIDTDATVLNNMDELFFLPSAKVAMPRAYWALPDTKQLSALVVVIEPSYREYTALMDNAGAAIYGQVGVSETTRYDVSLLNDRYADSALVLPHRQYGLVSSEFRRDDHRNFLGNEYEDWDPERVLAEAKIVHFADAPLPKPWIMWPQKLLVETLPKCKISPGTAQESGCQDRQVWRDLYNSFRRRRRDICRLLSYPAPEWPPKDNNQDAEKQPIPENEEQF
ncbi:nucleotide-diphospho-sugar transferase [Aspergillus campestris IBT 28561]|uniref:Nucleotide-diphospho-sugar transferase n=1 Tax=Aspergillus campestris (strain IBT 28561) TaxID=1392248 RepID=A0A2I1D1J6_ASPC2|nr:nucleotide-diphospho-sugar transferase [Aspergillus campestris IBT 28561]PKY03740.1 nucleotide-diphospho-sugar transferase [Aspergillus campestris IBT 28561]